MFGLTENSPDKDHRTAKSIPSDPKNILDCSVYHGSYALISSFAFISNSARFTFRNYSKELKIRISQANLRGPNCWNLKRLLQTKGPFTLAIFAAISAAISSAILRRFQIGKIAHKIAAKAYVFKANSYMKTLICLNAIVASWQEKRNMENDFKKPLNSGMVLGTRALVLIRGS